MEELLASQNKKLKSLFRGQQVEGEVVSISDKEIILDLGSKSEGVLQKRELDSKEINKFDADALRIGDKLKVFVTFPENENGQAVVSTTHQVRQTIERGGRGSSSGKRSLRYSDQRFTTAQNQKTKLKGQVLEINKGGLIVEVENVRGFLPNSQVGFELLSKVGKGMEDLVGQTLSLIVIEVDSNNNKLIFTQRGQVSQEVKNKLKEFKPSDKVSGKIVAVLPFGLVVDINGAEGLVFISDVAWEKIEDLTSIYKAGQTIAVVVTGIDEELGRLNLSIKQLSQDPFSKLVEKFPVDEIVKGEVIEVFEDGVLIKLTDSINGLLPAAKMEAGSKYEAGQKITVLIDSVDVKRRRINLAPFVTSTEGLIYK